MLTIYISTHCPFSKQLIDFLYEKKIPFCATDIAKDKESAIELYTLTGSVQTPVICNDDVSGEWKMLIGWNKNSKQSIVNYYQNFLRKLSVKE